MLLQTVFHPKFAQNGNWIAWQATGEVLIVNPGQDATPKQLWLCAVRLMALQYAGATLVDTRSPEEFAGGHVPGSINLPFASRSFASDARSFLDDELPFYLIIDPANVQAASNALARCELDRLAGYFMPLAVEEWSQLADEPLELIEQVAVDEVADAIGRGDLPVIDVRSAAEFAAGHLPHARNIPLSQVLDRMNEIPTDRPVVLYDKSGLCSSIAAGLLASQGRANVLNLHGGYQAWCAARLPVVDEITAGEIGHRRPPKKQIKFRRPQPTPDNAATSQCNPALPYWMEIPQTCTNESSSPSSEKTRHYANRSLVGAPPKRKHSSSLRNLLVD